MRDTLAWTLLSVLLCAFLIYVVIDSKLNWIAFGTQYERQQRGIVEAVQQLAQRVEKLEADKDK
jgi:hypothetical protein